MLRNLMNCSVVESPQLHDFRKYQNENIKKKKHKM